MADDAALKQWAKQLDKMENTLMEAISSRTRATASVQHTLKLAFKAVDLDEEGYGVETGKVSYEEFSKALEQTLVHVRRARLLPLQAGRRMACTFTK